MEALLVLLAVYLLAVLVVFPIWTLMKTGGLSDRMGRLTGRIHELEAELKKLRARPADPPASITNPEPVAAPAQAAIVEPEPVVRETITPPAPIIPPVAAVYDRRPDVAS